MDVRIHLHGRKVTTAVAEVGNTIWVDISFDLDSHITVFCLTRQQADAIAAAFNKGSSDA